MPAIEGSIDIFTSIIMQFFKHLLRAFVPYVQPEEDYDYCSHNCLIKK